MFLLDFLFSLNGWIENDRFSMNPRSNWIIITIDSPPSTRKSVRISVCCRIRKKSGWILLRIRKDERRGRSLSLHDGAGPIHKRALTSRVKLFPIVLFSLLALSLSKGEGPVGNKVTRHNGIEFARPDGIPLLLDLHLPEGVKNPPLMVWIHGGGWKGGARSNCKVVWAARRGYAVASIEYRFSQEALFPAQIHDCKGAVRWLRANAEKYGYNAENVVVGGSSAGGHLAALMGTSGEVADLEGVTGGNADQSSRVQGVIDYYGPSDFVQRSKVQPSKTEEPEGGVFQLLGGKVSENLEKAIAASPVTYVSKDDPPMLILHGAKDKTVFLDQSEILRDAYFKDGLEAELIVNPQGGHGWKQAFEGERESILSSLKKWIESE